MALGIHQAETTGGDRGVLRATRLASVKEGLPRPWRQLQGQGKVTTFLTETPTLFTDFWRDLRDIDAEREFN